MILLVVDTQNGITDNRLFNFDAFTKNIALLISTARKNNKEVIFVRHDDGPGTGFSVGDYDFEVYDGFKPMASEKIFNKTVNSAFFPNVGLLDYVNSINEKDFIVVGLQTDYCIDATIKDGFSHGFKIYVPENTNSTFNNQYMDGRTSYEYYNKLIWADRYAKCISIDDALKLLK